MMKMKIVHKKKRNIELALKAFINERNNRNHKVTKIKPNHLIVSKDDVLIETVRNRINTYYEKLIPKQNNTLTNGTKVFIVGAVSKQANRQQIAAVDKKKMSSTDNTIVKKMAAIVISTEDLYKRKVEVKICSKPIKNIKMGEVYRIDTELSAVVTAHTWKEFVEIVFVKKTCK